MESAVNYMLWEKTISMKEQAARYGFSDKFLGTLAGKVWGLRNRVFVLSDVILIPACAFLAFASRYEGVWHSELTLVFLAFLLLTLPLKLLILFALGLYRRLWRYASVSDLELLVTAAVACALVDGLVGVLFLPRMGIMPGRLSYAVILLDACLVSVAIAGPRLTLRILARRDRRSPRQAMRSCCPAAS